jgi:hypothetical protein
MVTTQRTTVAAGAVALCLALALSLAVATPAAAVPPHAEPDPQVAMVFPDLDNGLVGYVNFTRADFCAWEAGGSVGPPPFLQASLSWLRVTGTGEVSGNARGNLHVELWPLDDDAALESSCDDTSAATGPFAVGRADVRASQMPLEHDDGRGAWLGKAGLKADLTGSDGTRYRYHAHVIELYDGKGRVRHIDAAHFRLTTLP